MSMKLRASSGSYNVRASEMARELRQPNKTIQCIIHFLDDTQEAFEIDKKSKSQVLLDKVFEHLELIEKDYFGLQFVDLSPTQDTMRWLDPLKTVKKQMRVGPPYIFYFRVKFYVSDPSRLQEEYTRYHFFLQLKKDILEGRLVVAWNTAAVLSSYAVQSELGDYNSEEHTNGYLSEFAFIPNQNDEFEKEVAKLHKTHRGQTPADAEYNFLERAKRLDMYGVDLHYARDQHQVEIQLGVHSSGLSVFQNNVKINTFSWAKIVKISFKRKQFFIQLRRELVGDISENMENLIGFNMISYRSCKNLWKSCVEHHTFFRLHTPLPPKKHFFSLGSKFRYSGRTEYQSQEESKRHARIERSFSRSPSKRYARRTIGGTTRDVICGERNIIDRRKNFPNSNSVPNMRQYVSMTTATIGANNVTNSLKKDNNSHKNWHEDKSDDEGGFLSRKNSKRRDIFGTLTSRSTCVDEDATSCPEQLYQLPLYNDQTLPNGGAIHHDSVVTIRMKPDEQGRFGFNVKGGRKRGGGADQNMPIIVSRVAPGTPADTCIPRLNEGDQVLYINGRDVSQHTHEQVVMFIRASRENHSGELELIVRPNVYYGEDPSEEPDFQYIPDTHHISSTVPQGDMLSGSLMLLQEALENGAALGQFDQLYRKKPDFTMQDARLPENIPKNRYRDISPYDQTRVQLKSASSGDYINANYVNMEIPKSAIVNRYIAAQGPLPNTTADFWQMVWEQQSRLVVMLTTKVERGRVKCHQYWPDLYETADFGTLQLTCLKEQVSSSFAFREFTLISMESSEERHIKQMQYIAWPDHGVPDESSDFLDFVQRVRKNRTGMHEPTIVHCSAGIGRTGVLITMETALCLIEANQPVYPLDIVRQMRDQRAMLIQTASQYKFVCEAILRVYHGTSSQMNGNRGRETII
ncbi:tyrosine-protein phosphatase non-receptor type 4-like isoform X2 [Tubulanus polymorphus]|uniref:tyrosine-protein phosphatase non-receptor type 4-like isoform X2 n=1 Tax=Tubulanus polymorphus TaxID=672921 RepID=UPI003DA63C1C